ncbi:hypothetical protein TTHERM_00013330 (macronuclear) [Tetrahymena thermophila SB210]|uniref:Uncharacterized protein n=1 Tax=Tetrahymena thermophila (strain SB210) TaxID=312017 RepID=Q22RQ5_TETTS|nr:hypothetical protein TTHERM_00013330 [Tetrahymena thermophila SB210]EAR88067.2 hypothetical protein TTHERM_00013330 [Tetrahymena thermophila SB210]|eukprot:XP_001008312.2 hypothetical protein TTHERM_00013330 [Tetrahymena thermophila SB210]
MWYVSYKKQIKTQRSNFTQKEVQFIHQPHLSLKQSQIQGIYLHHFIYLLKREQPYDSKLSTQDDPYKNEILKLKNTQQPEIIGQRNYLKKQEPISQIFSVHFQQNKSNNNPLIIAKEDSQLELSKHIFKWLSTHLTNRTPFVDRKTKSTFRKDKRYQGINMHLENRIQKKSISTIEFSNLLRECKIIELTKDIQFNPIRQQLCIKLLLKRGQRKRSHTWTTSMPDKGDNMQCAMKVVQVSITHPLSQTSKNAKRGKGSTEILKFHSI